MKPSLSILWLLATALPLSAGSIATSEPFILNTADQLNSAPASSEVFAFSTFPAYGPKGEASTATSSGFWINTSPKPFSEFSFNILDANGTSLADANIYALVNGFIQGISGATSANGAAQLSGGTGIGTTFIISKPGYLPISGNLTQDQATDASLTATLTPLPEPPAVEPHNAEITEAEKGGGTNDGMRVFHAGAWTSGTPASLEALVNPTLPTVVMAHGWNSDLNQWGQSMAQAINGTIHPQQVNIVGWWWKEAADTTLPPIAEAANQGIEFGQALYALLGSNYSQHLHFIGHSLGTIVNASACDAAHGNCGALSACDWKTEITTPHVTLLDEASLANPMEDRLFIARSVADAVFFGVEGNETLANVGTTKPSNDWIKPIPLKAEFIDNYISSVGSYQEKATNILITSSVDRIANRSIPSAAFPFGAPGTGLVGRGAILVSEATGMAQVIFEHSHAPIFYIDHILASRNGNTSVYHWSREANDHLTPPGRPLGEGLFFYENITTPEEDVTSQAPDFDWVSVIRNEPPALGMPAAKLRALGISATSASLINSGSSLVTEIKEDIEFAADVAVESKRIIGDSTSAYITYTNHLKDEALETVGEVGYQSAVTAGTAWEAGTQTVSDTVDWLSETAVIEKLAEVQLPRFNLTDTFSLFKGNRPRAKDLTPPTDAGVWLRIEVPLNVSLLSFDMKRTGETGRDNFVCAIDGQNQYRIPAALIPETWAAGEFIDVTAFKGQTIEVFFGFIGQTASQSNIAVRGLRFVTFPKPEMALSVINDKIVLEMPQNLNGMTLEGSESLKENQWGDLETSAIERDGPTLRMTFEHDDFQKFFFRFAQPE